MTTRHAFPLPHRWIYLWLVSFLAVGALKADFPNVTQTSVTYVKSGGFDAGSTITFSVLSKTQVRADFSSTPRQNNGAHWQDIELYCIDPNGTGTQRTITRRFSWTQTAMSSYQGSLVFTVPANTPPYTQVSARNPWDHIATPLKLDNPPPEGMELIVKNVSNESGVYGGSVSIQVGKRGGVMWGTLMAVVPPGSEQTAKIDVGEGSFQLSDEALYVRMVRMRSDGREFAEDRVVLGSFVKSNANPDYPKYRLTVSNTTVEVDRDGGGLPIPPVPPNPDTPPRPPDPDTLPGAPNVPTPPTPPTPPAPPPRPPAPPPDRPIWPPPDTPVPDPENPDAPATTVRTATTSVSVGGYTVKTTTTNTTDADGNTSSSTAVDDGGAGEAGGAHAADGISGVLPNVSPAGSHSVGGSAPSFKISMPSKFGGADFDLNPFRDDRLGPVIDWFRVAMAWLCIILYGIWISKEVGEWMKGVSTIRQAQGNPVVGGTGAQATALVAAAAITVAVATFTVALISWISGDIVSLSAMLQAVGVNPMSGAPAGVAWMLDKTFPIATMITCLVARMSFNFYAAKIFAVAMSVIRFIVP